MMIDRTKSLFEQLNYLLASIVLCVGFLISSCNEQARGFALPEGDIQKGKTAFKNLACNECHSISGIAWKGGSDSLKINLGGEVAFQKSYGELVTSVINPSHKVARRYRQKSDNDTSETVVSKMRNYNEAMTVQELVDLVTFLQSEYDVRSPSTHYHPYY